MPVNPALTRRSLIGLAGGAAIAAALGLASRPNAALAAGAAVSKNASDSAQLDKLVFAWLPSTEASNAENDATYQELKKVLSDSAGLPVEFLTTTDYNITIEAIASGKAHLASLGGEGYVQAHAKNPAVIPLVIAADTKGTSDGAKYYSLLAVPADQLDTYKQGDAFTLDPIKGKRMSFVSASSTSGFKVPGTQIVKHFGLGSTDELTREGFFSQVLFGSSHQGSLVNLCQGDADVAAFDDELLRDYCELTGGEELKPGATYRVRDDAADPLDRVKGFELGIIQVIPVLNGPFAVNTDVVPADIIKKLQDGLTAKSTADDPLLFGDKDSAMYTKEKNYGFTVVEDSWYDPVRALEDAGTANADTTAGSSAADKSASAKKGA